MSNQRSGQQLPICIPGGGGMLGGPPAAPGIGCCCRGGWAPVVEVVPGGAFGSTSSHSADKSPELNLEGNKDSISQILGRQILV